MWCVFKCFHVFPSYSMGPRGVSSGLLKKDPHLPRNLRSVGLGLTKSCALVGLSLIQKVFQTASGIHSKPKHQSQQPQKNTSQRNITNIRNITVKHLDLEHLGTFKRNTSNPITEPGPPTPWNPPFSHFFGEHFYFGHTMSHSTSSAEAVFANVV